MKNKTKRIKNLITLFVILIFQLNCSSNLNTIPKIENPNSILGHWLIDNEKFELAMREEYKKHHDENELKRMEMGIKMGLRAYKNYYITFAENTFEEYNPMGKTAATGSWKIINNQLVRDYNINEMVKKSIEMMDKWKPIREDFETDEDFKLEMENHNNEKNEILKELHQVSTYSLSENELIIKITSAGRNGERTIPLQLKRNLN